jgi:hypothetical protein
MGSRLTQSSTPSGLQFVRELKRSAISPEPLTFTVISLVVSSSRMFSAIMRIQIASFFRSDISIVSDVANAEKCRLIHTV